MTSFDGVADAYDAARPEYPEAVYDALEAATGPLRWRTVFDGGAGTGIASRALAARGAHVVAFDIGVAMLRRAVARDEATPAVAADGNRLLFRTGSADVVCFAQAWHWLDPAVAVPEVARARAWTLRRCRRAILSQAGRDRQAVRAPAGTLRHRNLGRRLVRPGAPAWWPRRGSSAGRGRGGGRGAPVSRETGLHLTHQTAMAGRAAPAGQRPAPSRCRRRRAAPGSAVVG